MSADEFDDRLFDLTVTPIGSPPMDEDDMFFWRSVYAWWQATKPFKTPRQFVARLEQDGLRPEWASKVRELI